MNQITIDIQYSLESDITRVVDTYKRIDWYTEHGYAPHLVLPHGLTPTHTPSREEISRAVVDEYTENVYAHYAQDLQSAFQNQTDLIDQESLPITFLTKYSVQLTRYGTGGSYSAPDTVIINIVKNRSGIKTLFHEMMHLAIDEKVKKYLLDQAQKERVVDLLFKKIFPHIQFEQKRFSDQAYIDDIFQTEYSNIEKILERIKNSTDYASK